MNKKEEKRMSKEIEYTENKAIGPLRVKVGELDGRIKKLETVCAEVGQLVLDLTNDE